MDTVPNLVDTYNMKISELLKPRNHAADAFLPTIVAFSWRQPPADRTTRWLNVRNNDRGQSLKFPRFSHPLRFFLIFVLGITLL
jgi:hypothetical protein